MTKMTPVIGDDLARKAEKLRMSRVAERGALFSR